MSEVTAPRVQRWYHLNAMQLFWLALQPILLIAAVLWQWLMNPEAARLFWSDAVGLKLAVSVVILLAINCAVLLGGCLLLNFLQAVVWHGATWQRPLLQGVLYFGCLIFLYLPALFSVVIGPSAVALQRTLMSP